jgi:hypothetical protein
MRIWKRSNVYINSVTVNFEKEKGRAKKPPGHGMEWKKGERHEEGMGKGGSGIIEEYSTRRTMFDLDVI